MNYESFSSHETRGSVSRVSEFIAKGRTVLNEMLGRQVTVPAFGDRADARLEEPAPPMSAIGSDWNGVPLDQVDARLDALWQGPVVTLADSGLTRQQEQAGGVTPGNTETAV